MRVQTLIFLPLISTILALSPPDSLNLINRGGFTTRAIAMAQHLRITRANQENTPPHLDSITNTTTTFVEKSIPGGYINAPSAAPSLRGKYANGTRSRGFISFNVPGSFPIFRLSFGIAGVSALPGSGETYEEIKPTPISVYHSGDQAESWRGTGR